MAVTANATRTYVENLLTVLVVPGDKRYCVPEGTIHYYGRVVVEGQLIVFGKLVVV